MWLSSFATPAERLTRLLVVLFATAVLIFLIAPIFIIVPLSFSSDPFFTFPVPHYSLRWYYDFCGNERWINSIINSAVTAVFTTIFATVLGTMASLGLSKPDFPYRQAVMALLISPMIVPIVIVAVGSYLFFGQLGLTNTRPGLVLAHPGHAGHRNTVDLRHQSDACCVEPRRAAAFCIFPRDPAEYFARYSIGCDLRFRDLV